jgi:hypothetical protein
MNNSGVNTVLLVLIVAILIFGLVWLFRSQSQEQEGLNVELNLPAEDTNENQP